LSEEILKIAIICGSCLLAFALFIIASKKKWLSSFSLGKNGLEVKASVEKQFQSGTFNKLLDDQVAKYDIELINFAIQKAHELRRSFTRELKNEIGCTSARRALVSVLRFPLYERCRIDNFKQELKEENIKWYIKRVLKDVRAEYDDFVIDQENAICPIYKDRCVTIPSLASIIGDLEKRILNDWALPIKRKQIDVCEAKIKLYRQYVQHFIEINDQVRIKRTEYCIEKNKNYINELKRSEIDAAEGPA